MRAGGKRARRLDASIVTKGRASVAEADVRTFLEQNPDFLARNPELIAVLHPPSRHAALEGDDGDGIVEFHKFQIERLQEYLSELDHYQNRLIAATRSNIANQQRIHEAALAALAAETISELVHTVTQDWCDMLDVDVVGLGLVIPRQISAIRRFGIVPLEGAWIDGILGFDDAAIFRETDVVGKVLFGPATPLVSAEAVARLGGIGSMPEGLLAFGTRDEAGFYPGQGTELLRFLARVLDHSLDRCLQTWMIART